MCGYRLGAVPTNSGCNWRPLDPIFFELLVWSCVVGICAGVELPQLLARALLRRRPLQRLPVAEEAKQPELQAGLQLALNESVINGRGGEAAGNNLIPGLFGESSNRSASQL